MPDAIETLRLLVSDAAEAFGEIVDDETVALDRLEALVRAAEAACALQPEMVETFRSHGIVFTDIGNDPTNWQHVAFTAYSGMCEMESFLRPALRAVKGEKDGRDLQDTSQRDRPPAQRGDRGEDARARCDGS